MRREGHSFLGAYALRLCIAGALVGAALAAGAAKAPGATVFCAAGPGAEQCQNPQGLGVDLETGHLYIADRGNNRIQVFEASETHVGSFATAGAPRWVAVDNDPASSSHHDVYVGTELGSGQNGIQKFSAAGSELLSFSSNGACVLHRPDEPIAVGPGGTVYVADSLSLGQPPGGPEEYEVRILKFSPSGSCLEALGPLDVKRRAVAIAVDSAGSIYLVYDASGGGIHKYGANGASLYVLDAGVETNGIAVDGEGRLFASQRENRPGRTYQTISSYSATGSTLRRFGYDEIDGNLIGLAAYHSGLGDVFGSEGAFFNISNVRYIAEPPSGPLVPGSSVGASNIGNVRAKLTAEINPEGAATTYHFEYLTEEEFQADGEAFGAGTIATPESTSVGEDFFLHGAEATIGCANPTEEPPPTDCLEPNTEYRFRIVAKSSAGEAEAEGSFTTKPPLEINATYATGVGVDTADLHAQVNPLGIPATGYFEYVAESAYVEDKAHGGDGFAQATQIPAVGEGAAPFDFGSGEALVTRGANISPLAAATTYYYRLVVDDPLIEPLTGPTRSLTTFAQPSEPPPCPANRQFRTGPSALLPDCRAYELVSPLEKNNGDIEVRGEFTSAQPADVEQSATSGEKLTYGSAQAFGDAVSAPWTSQYIATRIPGQEWRSHAINPPREGLLPVFSIDGEFHDFSEDLCRVWLRSTAEPKLAPAAIAGYSNLYRRENCGAEADTYLPVTTIEPPDVGVKGYEVELQGTSADGSIATFTASDSLTDEAPHLSDESAAARLQLYWNDGSKTSFVCILPNGVASQQACAASTNDSAASGRYRGSTLRDSLSADGERVFWSPYTGSNADAGPIYLREHPGEKQSKIASGSCTQPSRACTFAVSAKGEEESGTSASIFWAASEDGSRAIFTTGGNLYEFDLESGVTTLIAHQSSGVMGASKDARWVYFASDEAIPSTGAEGRSPAEGQPNLYLYHQGSYHFIMTLTSLDANSRFAAISRRPSQRASRVAPDGQSAAFTSSASPFGYDNLDASSGQPDAEVYVYDAGTEALHCASCNPTNARPLGRNLIFNEVPSGRWAASYIPAWLDNFYGSRALADDGSRVFFNSTDALAPADSNGAQDVYEWETAGSGDCSEESPAFSPSNGGCVSLISSGQSHEDSRFVDADPSGANVFLATQSSLIPADYGLIDVYDARIDGGLPSPPPAPKACGGEACQSPPPAPEERTPGSTTFEGPDNVRGSNCGRSARQAKRLNKQARKLRGRALAAKDRDRARALSHKANRLGKRARQLSKRARRCRGTTGRAGR